MSSFRSLSIGAAFLVALAIAACSSSKEPPPVVPQDHIECAVGGAADLRKVCVVERIESGGQATLIVRHPDGAFRRFDLTTDGTGLVVADGSQPAVTRLDGDTLDVMVGADRYRFPATITPDAAGSDEASSDAQQ
ncbi:hypothetical protein WSK_0965 [Novosphingobium sp. Rr 2-17]|uniref:hypothetical protein n=1 Tax=Novosphingobium sp. Rr 2-17 TaxID=555793 RepID=UPI00026994E1|nr:hypothetical protein [Novosphingobium sp. Rr 2-17]EIZ80407.1 hypothetical protein WSK_0965 [Novosphingobium sp. Rr 2-17]